MMEKRSFFDVRTAGEILDFPFLPDEGKGVLLSQGFKVDSRLVEPGDVFVARRGEKEDGHDYIKDAVASGASAVLLDRSYYEEHEKELRALGVVLMPVQNSEKGLVTLASAWLQEVSPSVVGITGSVGKTTTREFLAFCLRKERRVHAAGKSYNTLVGCSLTVLAMPADTEILVLELGTSHPGEIREMVFYFPVTHGVITEVAPAHLEGLESLEGVLAAKMELTTSRKLSFLSYNNDNKILSDAVASLPERIETWGVGMMGSDTGITEVEQRLFCGGEAELSFTLAHGGEMFPCKSSIFGKQHARNLSYAFVLADALGVDPRSVLESFEDIELLPGRGRILRGECDCIVIDETYNANPASLSFALKNVQEIRLVDEHGPFRKIAVVGGMRELGADSERWHKNVLQMVDDLDELYLIGEEWCGVRHVAGEIVRGWWQDVDDFLKDVPPESFRRSVVMLKGSRYYRLERILPALLGDRDGD